jgi:FeS assembly SUF system regulator
MIRLSRLADYAVVLLAQMSPELSGAPADKVLTAADLAERTGLPLPTVSKVLKQLAKSDLIDAHRGAMGGYRLAKAAHEITVAAIITAMEGPIAIADCVDHAAEDEIGCAAQKCCALRGNWQMVNDALKEALEKVTLADMMAPACRIRAAAASHGAHA